MRTALLFIFFLQSVDVLHCQSLVKYSDSIMKSYRIPGLAFAVIGTDTVIEQAVLGLRKINTNNAASINDKFRIGSNTKTITALLAAILVHQNKISWDTRFFDLFPEMKKKSNPAYHNYTLLNLLSFRTSLMAWTYTNETPAPGDFKGNEAQQRKQFMAWIFKQKPDTSQKPIRFCNPAYVAAGMMLEKCSGKSYKELVGELRSLLDIDFSFGPPNLIDSMRQPWGHNLQLEPEPPAADAKLSWLLPAGNVSMALPDFARLLREQMLGLAGRSKLLSQAEFEFIFKALPDFSLGWYRRSDPKNRVYYYHGGNPGSFLSKVYLFESQDKALILLSNCQTLQAEQGLELIFRKFEDEYLR